MENRKFNLKDYQSSDLYGFAVTVLEVTIAALALWAAQYSFKLWWIALPVLTRSQFILLDNFGHYAAHRTLFKTRRLNELLGVIYFYTTFMTMDEWWEDHHDHHKYLGTEEDPTEKNFKRHKLADGFWQAFLKAPFRELRGNFETLAVWRDLRLCLFWVCVISVVALFGLWQGLLAWLITYFFLFPYYYFLSEVLEHWNVEKNHAKWSNGSRMLIGYAARLLKPYHDNDHWMHHEKMTVPPQHLHRAYRAYTESEVSKPKEETLSEAFSAL